MIQYVIGDMLQAEAEALVNTVNTVGVMGKGIALQFKEAFPHNYKIYADACKRKELIPGKLLAVWDSNSELGKKLIINFPTKTHWKSPSKYEYIKNGLIVLKELIIAKGIASIALPPLGCGNGGLEWNKVRPMIEEHLDGLSIHVMVFEPNAEIKAVLQKQESKKTANLTVARAQLLYALFAYESLGEFSSLFAANKLAYFLQRLGQPLQLDFKPHFYGPYAAGVDKVLYALNGIYVKGYEQREAKAFEPLRLNYERWEEIRNYVENEMGRTDVQRLKSLLKLLDGFSSELSLEILATTDFILNQNPKFSVDDIMQVVSEWTDRKHKLFKRESVEMAYNHLLHCRELYN